MRTGLLEPRNGRRLCGCGLSLLELGCADAVENDFLALPLQGERLHLVFDANCSDTFGLSVFIGHLHVEPVGGLVLLDGPQVEEELLPHEARASARLVEERDLG